MASRPTYSAKAERALIGACLYSGAAREILVSDLTPDDFYVVAHQRYVEAIISLHRTADAVDPLTVTGWISDKWGAAALDPGTGAALTDMMAEVPSSTGAATYAKRIRDRAARRKLRAVLEGALSRVDDTGQPVADIADDVTEHVRGIDLPGDTTTASPNISEFMATRHDYHWLIPHVLERTDRLIITAGDGRGKSTLLRQLAVQAAAGIHPFSVDRYEPIRVLILDLENSPPQVQRSLRRLYQIVNPLGRQGTIGDAPDPYPFDPDRVRIEIRPQGIDLLSRTDRQWLTSRIKAARPDLILTGPLYKLHRANPNEEQPAADLAAYFDEIRHRFDTGLIIEAHPPHGTDGGHQRTLRPYGAALWMRWPEFGFGIRIAKDGGWDWVPWRGARDEARWWPQKLLRGQTWPWEPAVWFNDEEPF